MNEKKSIFKNVVASALPQVANIISNLILPTLIIVAYGSSINGLTSTIKQIISYVSLIGMGIAVATTQSLYAPVAKNDIKTVCGMLKAADKMFNRSGTAYTIIVLIVSFIYPLFVIGDVNYITMVGLMIVMSVSGASEFFVVGRCRSLLYAHQKVYISSIIQAVSIILSLGCALVLIKLNYGIIVVQLSISGVYIFRAIGLELYVRKNYSEYRDYKQYKPIDKAVEKRNDALIHQITGLISTGSQSIVLSVIVGLEAASVFAVYNIVFSGLLSVCSNINTAITPFLGRTIAVGDIIKVKKQFNILEFCFFNISAFIFAVCSVMIIPFISLYTRGADINYIDPLMALFFVIYSTCNVLRLPGQAIINASGSFKETRWRAIIEASSCLVLSIIFTLIWGRIGVLVGTSFSMAWRCIDIIVYANSNILNQSNKKSLFRLVRSFAVIFIIWYLFRQLDVTLTTYIQWVCYSLLVAIITIFIMLINVMVFDRGAIKNIVKELKKDIVPVKN